MRRLTKARVLKFVVASLIACVFTFLVITITLFVTPNTITLVSAVETSGFGVYWDNDCSDQLSSIDWGALEPGSVKNIKVYIRNEGEEPMRLILSTTNWDPSQASEYLNLGWNYTDGRRIDPGETIPVTLTLFVHRYIERISIFTFDILITASNRPLGDVNGDGKVNAADKILVGIALFTSPGDPGWNPDADVNQSGRVGADDKIIVCRHLFESWP